MGTGHDDQAEVGSVGWARIMGRRSRKEGSRGCLALTQGADLNVEPSSVWSKTKGLAAGSIKLVI